MSSITKVIKKKGKKQYTQYITTLPKDTMDSLYANTGDKLIFMGNNMGILSFKYERKNNQ